MLDGFNEGEYHFLHESVHPLKEKQIIAVLTISTRTIRGAMQNPVKSLRTE